jgi:hypothetical protein
MPCDEAVPLVAAPHEPRSRRRIGALTAALSLSGFGMLVHSQRTARKSADLAEGASRGSAEAVDRVEAEGTELAAALVDADDTSDVYSYSYLYDCVDGKPDVPEAYKNGSWGSVAGEWYVVAGEFTHSSNAAGACTRMKFTLPTDDTMNQYMMYNNDDGGSTVDYYWNMTNNVEWSPGRWTNTGQTASDGHVAFQNFWSGVFLVGSYNGAKYWGWYECGDGGGPTSDGVPWILANDKDLHSDETFVTMIEEKWDELGLSASGNFTTYSQGDDCNYIWHHISVDQGGI